MNTATKKVYDAVETVNRNDLITVSTYNKKRKPCWKNIGWAVSWLMFWVIVAPVSVISIITTLDTGVSFIQSHPGLMCFCLAEAAWTILRNPIGVVEYLRRWSEDRRR